MKDVFLFVILLCFVVNSVVGCVEKGIVDNPISEVTKSTESMTDEYIIAKFNEAYDFWMSWVYGQKYRAYDNLSDQAFGLSRESITSESTIQSTTQLREEMEKHFTKGMTDMYFAQLVPEDKDGKLYVYTADVGGPYSGPKNITVEKINDKCYLLNLDIWSYMEDEEPDFPDQCVYYVFENGKWVFENNEEDEFFYSWGEG